MFTARYGLGLLYVIQASLSLLQLPSKHKVSPHAQFFPPHRPADSPLPITLRYSFPSAQPCLQLSFARRTSGYCLGTFRAVTVPFFQQYQQQLNAVPSSNTALPLFSLCSVCILVLVRMQGAQNSVVKCCCGSYRLLGRRKVSTLGYNSQSGLATLQAARQCSNSCVITAAFHVLSVNNSAQRCCLCRASGWCGWALMSQLLGEEVAQC